MKRSMGRVHVEKVKPCRPLARVLRLVLQDGVKPRQRRMLLLKIEQFHFKSRKKTKKNQSCKFILFIEKHKHDLGFRVFKIYLNVASGKSTDNEEFFSGQLVRSDYCTVLDLLQDVTGILCGRQARPWRLLVGQGRVLAVVRKLCRRFDRGFRFRFLLLTSGGFVFWRRRYQGWCHGCLEPILGFRFIFGLLINLHFIEYDLKTQERFSLTRKWIIQKNNTR